MLEYSSQGHISKAIPPIGGMDMQKQEMREAVELPLSHFDLYKQIGIDPPRGLYICFCGDGHLYSCS